MRVPKAKVENQPNLLEQWEGVTMHVEDFKPETVIGNALAEEKGGSFLETIEAEVKDVFGKENVPATAS